jgi:hypothetical protein
MLTPDVMARAKKTGASSTVSIPFSTNPTPIPPRVQRTRLFCTKGLANSSADRTNNIEKRTIAVAEAGFDGYRSIMSVELMLKIAVAVNAALLICGQH